MTTNNTGPAERESAGPTESTRYGDWGFAGIGEDVIPPAVPRQAQSPGLRESYETLLPTWPYRRWLAQAARLHPADRCAQRLAILEHLEIMAAHACSIDRAHWALALARAIATGRG